MHCNIIPLISCLSCLNCKDCKLIRSYILYKSAYIRERNIIPFASRYTPSSSCNIRCILIPHPLCRCTCSIFWYSYNRSSAKTLPFFVFTRCFNNNSVVLCRINTHRYFTLVLYFNPLIRAKESVPCILIYSNRRGKRKRDMCIISKDTN